MKKKSICLFGHRTSITLEQEFWNALKDIALLQGISLQKLVEYIDEHRTHENLSAAIRIYVLHFYQSKSKNIL